MSRSKNLYLGKSGKVFGPYTSDELDQMSVSGKLEQFTWLWNDAEKKWAPLEAPPPAPMSMTVPVSGKEKQGQASQLHVQPQIQIEAICYDLSQLIKGTLEAITQTGCTLVTPSDGEVPKVLLGNKTYLSLLHDKSGKNVTLPVQMFKQSSQGGKSLYWLRWNEIPEILNGATR